MKITKLLLVSALLLGYSFNLKDSRTIYDIPLRSNIVLAADLNLDGNKDIIVNHAISPPDGWGGYYILNNDGFGHFDFYDSITGGHGGSVACDTVISSMYLDLIANMLDSIAIYSLVSDSFNRNTYRSGPKISKFSLGDVDHNGKTDIAFVSNNLFYWGIIYNQGDGIFSEPEHFELDFPPTDIQCGKLTNDSIDDILIMGAQPSLYTKSDTGFTVSQFPDNAREAQIIDIDNDGDNDVFMVTTTFWTSRIYVYLNDDANGLTLFNNFSVPFGSSSFESVDFNNDSLPDLLFLPLDLNHGLMLYYNMGNNNFADSTEIVLDYYNEERRFMDASDMDGNGFNDIIISRQLFNPIYESSPLEILFNDGFGNFGNDPLTQVSDPNLDHQDDKFQFVPNPFSENTCLRVDNFHGTIDQVTIYSLKGEKIKSLQVRSDGAPGVSTSWDGTNRNGHYVEPGVYLAVIVANGKSISKRILFMN